MSKESKARSRERRRRAELARQTEGWLVLQGYEETVAATNARVGRRVRVVRTQRGRTRELGRGVLAAASGEWDDGRVVYSIGPGTGFALHPRLVGAACERPDGRFLRVGLADGTAFLIETLV